jgi:poly-gamma-glutamate synthesis protein (capsule biosynthesis protein)
LQGLFRSADLVMVNCETAITRSERKEPKQFNFKMNPDLVGVFPKSGISLVTLANNHVYDYGVEGLRDTLRYLDQAGVEYVGAGMNLAEARKPVIRDIKGKRFAFLGYGNYSPATEKGPGVAYRYAEHVTEDVRRVKDSGADIVIVNFHWGVERATEPTARDKALAYLAIESGADVIVGHHPHVLQPVELYKGKVIAYSLGNFVFGGNRRAGKDSALLEILVAPSGDISHRLLPIRIDTTETRYQPYLIESEVRLAEKTKK